MNKILLISLIAASLIGASQAEAYYYYHHHHHGWHHSPMYGHSGTVGRLGRGASPLHPEGPGNPAGGR
jgi:hypothetical protein